jgi:hypothetical protein
MPKNKSHCSFKQRRGGGGGGDLSSSQKIRVMTWPRLYFSLSYKNRAMEGYPSYSLFLYTLIHTSTKCYTNIPIIN